MAAFMLESLVLRGVAVVSTGSLGYLRLGRGVAANGPSTAIDTPWQPLPGTRPDNFSPSGGAPNVVDTTKGASPGAGRSRRHAGSPCCRETARTTITATHAWRLSGGQARAAAAKNQALQAGFVASADEVGVMRAILAAPLTGREERSR
jgi:hypothetical protein